jgi:DNA-binding SARP family transcriptional activator
MMRQPEISTPHEVAERADRHGNGAEQVAFGLLGPLLVLDGTGTVIHIAAAKQRIILATLLLSANSAVSPDRLAEAVWGPSRPPTAPAAIRTYVTRLRRTLGLVGARLVSRPTGYQIEVRQPREFDIAEVERLRIESREAAETGQWSRAASLAVGALSLWRGPPLADVPSAALDRPDVVRLEDLRLELMTGRFDAELHLGRASSLIAELRQLADEQPMHEHIQAQLMLAYYRSGRQADALGVYRKVRGTLVEELGIEPGPELSSLHQHILHAKP